MNSKQSFSWSEEAVELLRSLRARGISSSQIATELAKAFRAPVSRSAVIGKLSRLGIEYTPQARAVTERLSNRTTAKKPKKAKPAPKPEPVAEPVEPLADEAANTNADAISVSPCCIIGLTFSTCRWPLDRKADDGATLFCANAKREGSPYCDGHFRRAFVKTQTKAQRDLERAHFERNRQAAIAAGSRDRFNFSGRHA